MVLMVQFVASAAVQYSLLLCVSLLPRSGGAVVATWLSGLMLCIMCCIV